MDTNPSNSFSCIGPTAPLPPNGPSIGTNFTKPPAPGPELGAAANPRLNAAAFFKKVLYTFRSFADFIVKYDPLVFQSVINALARACPQKSATSSAVSSIPKEIDYNLLAHSLAPEPGHAISFLPVLKAHQGLSGKAQTASLLEREQQIRAFSKDLSGKLKGLENIESLVGEPVYIGSNFSIFLRKNKTDGYDLVLKKTGDSSSEEKIFCSFKNFQDPEFTKMLDRLDQYASDILPEVRDFLTEAEREILGGVPTIHSGKDEKTNRVFIFKGTGDRFSGDKIAKTKDSTTRFMGPTITGSDMPAEFKQMEKEIREKIINDLKNISESDSESTYRLNISGISRGCYNALQAARFLETDTELKEALNAKKVKLDIQLNLKDPVKGPTHNQLTKRNGIPKNVSRANVIYSKRAFLRVIDKGIVFPEDPATTKVHMSLQEGVKNPDFWHCADHIASFGPAKSELAPTNSNPSPEFDEKTYRGALRAEQEAQFEGKEPLLTKRNQAVINYLARRAEEVRSQKLKDKTLKELMALVRLPDCSSKLLNEIVGKTENDKSEENSELLRAVYNHPNCDRDLRFKTLGRLVARLDLSKNISKNIEDP